MKPPRPPSDQRSGPRPPQQRSGQGAPRLTSHGGGQQGAGGASGQGAGPRPPFHKRPAQQGQRPSHGGAPATPSGAVWIYGLHPVAAALANPQRRARRLVLTEEGEAALTEKLPPPWAQQHERIDRARLDQMLGRDAVHQGVALLADPLPPPPLSSVLDRPGPLLVLDQVTDPRNVGAILRSAAAFAAAGVIVQDRHAPEETGAMAKAASGALETVPLIRAVNLSRTIVALKAAGLWTVGLAADAPALRGTALRERRVALVMGAEGTGLRRLTRETCDEVVGLSMPGDMESLNVSAAATVALYELTRSTEE